MTDGIHDSLIENGDGTVTCTICGYTFEGISYKPEIIESYVKNILNAIQTTKLLLNNPEIAGKMYDCIPIIEKLPELFELASKENEKKMNNYFNNTSFTNPWDYNKNYNTDFPGEYNRMESMQQLFNALSGTMPYSSMIPYNNDHNLKNK